MKIIITGTIVIIFMLLLTLASLTLQMRNFLVSHSVNIESQ